MALSIDELRNKVAEMTQQGLNTQQIADELSISQRTVIWLNSGAAEEEHPDDVRIGWRTIGARPNRIDAIGAIMADIVLEEEELGVDTVVGISLNGILFANSIANHIDADVAIFRSVLKKAMGTSQTNMATLQVARLWLLMMYCHPVKPCVRPSRHCKKKGQM